MKRIRIKISTLAILFCMMIGAGVIGGLVATIVVDRLEVTPAEAQQTVYRELYDSIQEHKRVPSAQSSFWVYQLEHSLVDTLAARGIATREDLTWDCRQLALAGAAYYLTSMMRGDLAYFPTDGTESMLPQQPAEAIKQARRYYDDKELRQRLLICLDEYRVRRQLEASVRVWEEAHFNMASVRELRTLLTKLDLDPMPGV